MIKQYIPLLNWIGKYQRTDFKSDLSAGITVAVMLVPQAMAYAMLAGLPPIMGLYASTIPLFVYALFGTSRQLAVGPVAIVSIMTAAGVGAIAESGSDAYITYAIALALMVGIIQFAMGMARFGFLVNFLSHPVISGFTSAAALIIGFSQLKHLMGVDIQRTHLIHEILLNAWDNVSDVNLITLSIGLVSIVTLIAIKKWKPLFPGALVVVILSTLTVWFFDLHAHGVKIVGDVPAGLPLPSLPLFDWEMASTLLPTAIAISMVSFMESISVAKAIARKNKYGIEANQELIGLGLANIVASLFKGYPITGGFSRTAVNNQAGAKTNLASIITASMIIIVLLLLTPLFYYLPKAVLAAIIMTAVYTLIDFDEVKHLYKVKRSDLALLAITFFATLSLGIEEGIMLGVGASLLWFVITTTRPHSAVLGRLPGTKIYRNLKNHPEAETDDGILVLRVDAQFYFGNVNFLKEFINKEISHSQNTPKVVIIEASSINQLDSSADSSLQEIKEDLDNRGIDIFFANVKGPVMEVMHRSGFDNKLGADHFFIDLHSAILQAKTRVNTIS